MRWFWALIVALVVLTGGLYANRVRAHTSPPDESTRAQPAQLPPRPVQHTKPHAPAIEEPAAQPIAEPIIEPVIEPVIEPIEEPIPAQTTASSSPITEPIVQPIEVPIAKPIEESPPEPTDQPIATLKPVVVQVMPEQPTEKPTEKPIAKPVAKPVKEPTPSTSPPETITQPEPDADPKPTPPPVEIKAPVHTYKLLADGSFTIVSTNEHIVGSGTAKDPFVLQWDLLSSVERGYNPKKGKEKLPDWLDLLDGKRVRIEGNSLVPVIATSTKELLVMQNPWDGCCVGVPPTPYDAIEVTLNQDVDFGSSATGYGHVEGTFVLDPYVVDGWVLGLYIIEDAQYRSGEGIEFSDF